MFLIDFKSNWETYIWKYWTSPLQFISGCTVWLLLLLTGLELAHTANLSRMFHSLLIHQQLISPIVLTYLGQVHFVVLYISVLINIYVLQILLLSIKRLLK